MKKRILGILLTLCMVLCLLPTAVLAADEMHNVTVKAAAGGRVSTDGTNWSDSVVVSVANGTTLGDRVQYKPDEGYKLDGVTATTAIKKVVASAANTAAVDDAGNLYTAGDNLRGQLARTLDFYVDEDSVLTKVSTSAKTIDVALGVDHIVVLDENGEVWTAGCNQYGALGIGENAGKYWYGTQIETLRKVTVGDGSVKIRAVAAGQYHTILIDENGGVWTAGYNSDGQLGRSENVNSGTPNTVFKKAEGLDNVKIVGASGGTAHTVLLDESGNVWTAGNNLHGQLGRQTAKNMDSKFEKVADGISGVKITAIAAGSRYTVLLDDSGNVWTAGSNGYGELGRETNGMSSSVFGKADLQGATAAKFIAAGGTTIVIDTDGNVRTSGINGHGQLGRDTGSESSDSKLLAVTDGIDGAEIIAAATGAGAYHSVLLDKNGVIRTCGANQCGQLCRNIDLTKSKTFAAVTDGMTQTMTFDEMKNTLITSDRLFTVTAVTREKVQFEYDLNGGNWADGFTPKDFYYKDEGLLLPDASKLERTGYTFAGWETSEPTADTIKCSAKWIADTYTVTFDSTGGSEVTTKTIDVLYGEQLGDMPVPIRTGYFFRGWYDAPVEGKCYGNSDGKGTSRYDKTENCTLYAQWVINRYTITFDTAGGSEIAPITQDYGTAITAPANPTREGYTFIGWDKAIPATMPAENVTVTAQWTVNQYTITFDTDGGSAIDPITQDYGTAINAPVDPMREGYTFLGWDKAIPTTMPAENVTITAQWKVNQYTITFDTNGGSTVAPITQDYGTQISAPANPTREGYTFIGWDKAIPATMPAENVTITAQWEINQYTITFDTNGGSEIAPITQDYGTAITAPANPTREGYTFIGWDKAIPATMPAENITLKAKWKDIEKPTGEIIIGTNKWSEFLNELTSGLFSKDPQEVTINAADNSGIVFASYLVTDQDLSEAELKTLVYRAYDEPFRIEPNGEYIVYVMLVDESLNITYLRSDRITLDNIPPVISGIEDGKTYCEAQTVTIIEKYVDTVTVNGTAVTLDENGSFVLSPENGKQKIVVTDKAGNTAEMTVTVNDGHTLLADDNDCTTPVYCKFCNEEVIAAKSHRFTGNWQNDETAHWHICQNENCTVTDRKTAHSGEDDGNCLTAVVCECGYVITAAKPAHTFNEWTSNGNGTHTRKCTVVGCNGIETDDCSGGKATCTEQAVCTVCHTGYGDALGHNFTIAQHDETHHWNKCSRCDATDAKAVHTGGTATCREKAVCEVCRSAYGKLSAANHVGGTEIRDAKPQSCIENGYTGDTYCKGCGEKLSSGTVIHADGHKGGTATCTDKAECEVCHEKYGEPDANHHTGLETVDAVPATAASTGTAAHWRCTACGKLFADADGKQEIRSGDTVTKKLAPSILDGANSEWRKGDENGLTFSSDAAFSDFVEVLVDGKTVASENYERQDSGTIVELKASYLETLAEGEHTLTIRSASGDATTRFTIAASDSTNAWVWIIIGFIALGIGVTVAVFVVRKRKTA